MKKIIYFTAGEKPTNDELAEIAKLNAQTVAAYKVTVMRGDDVASYEYGAGLAPADFVAGTVPDDYSDEEDYPVIDPDALPRPDTFADTQAVVNDGDDLGAVVTGTYTDTAEVTVEDGVITAITLS